MSVRRRAIDNRLAKARKWDQDWARSCEVLRTIQHVCETALADRAAHARLDDEGAPPAGEVPADAWRELIAETIRLSA